MSAVLIVSVVVLYSFQTLFCILFQNKYTGKPQNTTLVFNVLEGFAIALVSLAFSGFQFAPTLTTLILGVLNGLVLLSYNILLMRASKVGSYAFTNVAMLFGGILLPMGYSFIAPKWIAAAARAETNPRVLTIQLIAVGAMLAAFVLMNVEDIKLKGTPAVFYVLCLLLFICNGFYGVNLKLENDLEPTQGAQMIVITFFLAATVSLFMLLGKEKRETAAAFRINKQAILPLCICILSAALAINVLIFVLPLVDVMVLYTVENGGVLLLSALYAIFLFKEKAHPLKVAGIVLAIASLVVLSMPPALLV